MKIVPFKINKINIKTATIFSLEMILFVTLFVLIHNLVEFY